METVKEKPMTFKEFSAWCNERAADGCWGFNEARICIDVIREVRKQPRRKQETFWQGVNWAADIENAIVIPTNKKIREAFEWKQ